MSNQSCARAQSALEYLLITSFLLIVTAIIFSYATTTYSQASDLGQAKSAVATIVNTADQTYAFGEGSVLFVEVESPPNLVDITVDYVCKDDFNTTGNQECLVIDPDATTCCAAWKDSPANKVCQTPVATPDSTCFDFWSVDHQTLTVKRSYLIFTQHQAFGDANIYKQARGIIDMQSDAIAALLSPGHKVLKVDWIQSNGKIRVGLPGD